MEPVEHPRHVGAIAAGKSTGFFGEPETLRACMGRGRAGWFPSNSLFRQKAEELERT
jgi:hypothetical protein